MLSFDGRDSGFANVKDSINHRLNFSAGADTDVIINRADN
jgi:hypothetical protein